MAARTRSARYAVPAMLWDESAGPSQLRRAEGRGRVLAMLARDGERKIARTAVEFAGLDLIEVCGTPALFDGIATLKPDLILVDSCRLGVDPGAFRGHVDAARQTETLPVLFADTRAHDWRLKNTERASVDLVTCFLLIRSILRRERPLTLRGIRCEGAFRLNEPEFRIAFEDKALNLSKTDLCLLGPFFDAPQQIFDRQILERLAINTAHDESKSRKIDFYLSRTRRRIRNALGVDPIQSVRGIGYRLKSI